MKKKMKNKKLRNKDKKTELMIILILPADRAPPCSVNTLIGALPHLPPTKDKYKSFRKYKSFGNTKVLEIQKLGKCKIQILIGGRY